MSKRSLFITVVLFVALSLAGLRSMAQEKPKEIAAKPPVTIDLSKEEYHLFNSMITSRDEADKEIAGLEDKLFQQMVKRAVARQQIDEFVAKLPAGAVLQKDSKGLYSGYIVEKK